MHSYCTGKWSLRSAFLKAVSLVTSRYTLIETAFIVIIGNDVQPWWKHLHMYVSQLLLAFVVQLIWTARCYEVWWFFFLYTRHLVAPSTPCCSLQTGRSSRWLMEERVADTQAPPLPECTSVRRNTLPAHRSVRRNENNDLVLMIAESRGSDCRWTLLSGHNVMYIRGKGLLQDEYETWFERGSLQTPGVGTALQCFLMSSLRQAILWADIYNYRPYSCKVTWWYFTVGNG